MTALEKDLEMARRIALLAAEAGGRVYYVGGYVRDQLLHRENKDVDIEVHGLLPQQLENVLDRLGNRLSMGESFGIYSLKGYTLDIAMPQSRQGIDPFMGPKQAARRRDLTINALMQDVLTEETLDFFGGQKDLQSGVIRHVDDETFAEDPLRVLRAAQFAARFQFSTAPETIRLCSTLSLEGLAHERIEAEVQKALLKSPKPSVFFEELRRMNQLDVWFPELKALCDVPQNPRYHAEGDVWTHTMMVMDQAVQYRNQVQNPFAFMLSAVVHDFGKAVCTESVNEVIHAYNHEYKGLPLAEAFLRRLTNERKLIDMVLNLSEHHMKPIRMASDGSAIKATNHLFDVSLDPQALICLALADDQGRIPAKSSDEARDFLQERLDVYRETMALPCVMGRDLLEAGLKPDKRFSELLAYAHKLHLARVEKSLALRQTLAYARTLKN